jgi:hypothetical protein
MNFCTSDTFSPQKPNDCMPLLFGVCGEPSGHVDDASGTRQLNSQCQIHYYDNRDILSLLLLIHSAVGSVAEKNERSANTFLLNPHYL